MAAEVPETIKLRTALASPPPGGATIAGFVLLASLAALLVMTYAGSEWWSLGGGFGFSSDAGWTRAVIARNLASGRGFSFNPGTPLAGAAAPAWIGILAVGGFFTGFIFAAKLLGFICIVLASFLVWRITLDLLGDWRFALLAAIAVPCGPLLTTAALGGTEAALAALLLTAAIHWQAVGWEGSAKQTTVAALIAGLAALTRPEFVLIIPLLILDRGLLAGAHASERRRLPRAAHSLRDALIAALVVAPYLLHNWRAGGPLWQQPDAALRAQPPLAWGLVAIDLIWAAGPLLLCAAVLGLAVTVLAAARTGARHPSFLLALAPLVFLLAPGFIWRSASPENAAYTAAYLSPIIAILGSAGLFGLKRTFAQWLLRSRTRASRIAFGAGIALVIAGLLGSAWWSHRQAWTQYGFQVKKVDELQGYIGRWAAEHMAPDASIASRDIGAIAYFSRRRMIDLGGTIDPAGLSYLRRAGSPDSNLLAFMERYRPSHLAVRPADFPDLSRRADLLTPAITCGELDPLTGGITTWVLYETAWPAPSLRAARSQPAEPDARRYRTR